MTYIPLAAEVVARLKIVQQVTKIVCGVIKPASGGVARVKISKEKDNVRVTCRGVTAVQRLYVLGCDEPVVTAALKDLL